MAYGINQGGSSSFGFGFGGIGSSSFSPSHCAGPATSGAPIGQFGFNPFAQAFDLSQGGLEGARSLGQQFSSLLGAGGFGPSSFPSPMSAFSQGAAQFAPPSFGFPSAGSSFGFPSAGSSFGFPQTGASSFGFPQTGAPQMGFAPAGNQGSAQAGTGGQPTVAVIDDYVTDSDGYNHGNEIAGIIQNEGANALRLNIDNGGSRDVAILNSLDEVISRVQSGQRIDAVNLSQQNFGTSQASAGIQQRIQMLEQMGIPVAVAAGNNGAAGQLNSLANGASFRVANSGFGSELQAGTSAGGNILAEGRWTSQATPVVAAQAAALHAQGFPSSQIRGILQSRAQQQGGSLNA